MGLKIKDLRNCNFGFSLLVIFALHDFDLVNFLCRHGLVVLSDSQIAFSSQRYLL
jgi:hypothetical protein